MAQMRDHPMRHFMGFTKYLGCSLLCTLPIIVYMVVHGQFWMPACYQWLLLGSLMGFVLTCTVFGTVKGTDY